MHAERHRLLGRGTMLNDDNVPFPFPPVMYFADEMITGPARFDVDSQSGVGVTVVRGKCMTAYMKIARSARDRRTSSEPSTSM